MDPSEPQVPKYFKISRPVLLIIFVICTFDTALTVLEISVGNCENRTNLAFQEQLNVEAEDAYWFSDQKVKCRGHSY